MRNELRSSPAELEHCVSNVVAGAILVVIVVPTIMAMIGYLVASAIA